ncbi:MAG: Capsule biosynthesis protein capA [Ktedonobacterales bacterium]|jgi:poly-gamma-glutamate synthesis protein (capsule biosynthesis protein)|nr:MAG: Capsule biosynthesis protein capA [Ktedonobacterales bacterium]
MNDEPNAPSAPLARTTRRTLLRRAGLASLGAAASIPLAEWLAACGQPSARRSITTPSPTSAATATTRPTATPDARPVTIVITGDVMLARSVNSALLASSDRFPFNYTGDYLSGFDITVGNLECVVSTLGAPQPKQFTFEANPRAFARLQTAGFDVMSVANNHSGDYGKTAFTDMLTHLPSYGITPLGGGANLTAAHQPVVKTVHGTRIGFLAYCEIGPENFAATASTPGHAWLDPALIRADIAALRPQADFIIAFTHWGIEYQLAETAHQQAMARLAIDAGADLVVGAHPHVIQPYEMYRGKLIVYSLGNFVFDLMTGVEGLGNVLALTVQGSRLLNWKLRGMQIGSYGQPTWR